MLDEPMIQTGGFRNAPGGFEVRLRLPYYRGLWANLLEGASVDVDGEAFPADAIRWTIGDRSFTVADLREPSDLRWPVDRPAVLSVPRDEPLAIGEHDVTVELGIRMSYIPEELQPSIWTEQRKLVITR
jgi:hypothetical protein